MATAMSDPITIDGYQLTRNFHGHLKCLGAGAFGVVLHATAPAAAVKLGICETEQEFQDALKEKILLETVADGGLLIPEHPHILKLLSFHEHSFNSPSFSQSGALMKEMRVICEQKRAMEHPYPSNMLSLADYIPTRRRRYCVLAFEIAGEQDLITWFETSMQEGIVKDTLPDEQVRMVAKQMASALAHLHERGIVHHDFKGENVMITGAGSASLSSKLVDFGLARRAAAGHPGFCGSPPGAAPEMWRPRSASYIGAPADVWSYGGVPPDASSPFPLERCLAPHHFARAVLFFSLGIGIPPFLHLVGDPPSLASSLLTCPLFRNFSENLGGSAKQMWEEYPDSWKAVRKPHHEPASLLFDLLEPCLQLAPDARPSMQQVRIACEHVKPRRPTAPQLPPPLSHIVQIANHLEANSAGSWYQPPAPATAPVPAPAAAPAPEVAEGSTVYRRSKRPREAPAKFRSLGADEFSSLGADDPPSSDDAKGLYDAPPPGLRRMGALGPADWIGRGAWSTV